MIAFVATTLLLVASSLLPFGPEAWMEFLRAERLGVAHVIAGRLPLDRMPTVHAALLADGVASQAALFAQGMTTIVVVPVTRLVWSRAGRLSVRALAPRQPLRSAPPMDLPTTWRC